MMFWGSRSLEVCLFSSFCVFVHVWVAAMVGVLAGRVCSRSPAHKHSILFSSWGFFNRWPCRMCCALRKTELRRDIGMFKHPSQIGKESLGWTPERAGTYGTDQAVITGASWNPDVWSSNWKVVYSNYVQMGKTEWVNQSLLLHFSVHSCKTPTGHLSGAASPPTVWGLLYLWGPLGRNPLLPCRFYIKIRQI